MKKQTRTKLKGRTISGEGIAQSHIRGFAEAFVVRERRERFQEKLLSTKGRREYIERLNHNFVCDLKENRVHNTPPPDIQHYLTDDSAYIIADQKEYDDQIVFGEDRLKILDDAVFGIIVSFEPGVLAVYQDEDQSHRIWLY